MHRRIFTILAGAFALCGCGGDDDASSSCERPRGAWQITYSEVSGSCGALDDELGVVGDESDDDGKCESVERKWGSDNCSLEVEKTGCKGELQSGASVTLDVVASWERESDTKWTGVFDLRVETLEGMSCHSVYDTMLLDR